MYVLETFHSIQLQWGIVDLIEAMSIWVLLLLWKELQKFFIHTEFTWKMQ